MKVTITARHLKEGIRCAARRGPVALALAEATGGAVSVGISAYSINLGAKTPSRRYHMEAQAVRFIESFDCGRNPEPCTLELGMKEEP